MIAVPNPDREQVSHLMDDEEFAIRFRILNERERYYNRGFKNGHRRGLTTGAFVAVIVMIIIFAFLG